MTVYRSSRGVPIPVDQNDDHGKKMCNDMAIERRNRIAEGFAFALATQYVNSEYLYSDVCNDAVSLADALIAELDK